MDFAALNAVVPPQDVVYLMACCGVCAALDAWLPATPPNSRWWWLRRVLSLLGQNYRHAANGKAVVPETGP